MGPGKKDLEIVYNLQWKNVSGHGDDKANIVGMYDIPATTLNWETFKSYLLKNSGATGDDVKVSYVSIDDKEFPIESQLDFQIALYSFRQRARNGDIITLKLDRITDQGRVGRMKRLRRSAEPRMEEEKVQVACENAAPLVVQNDAPPDWFKKYMKSFKKEIVEEVTTSVINQVSTLKTQNSTQVFPCHHTRKSKVECCKRPRKVPLVLNKPDTNDMELIKSLKLERKLDCKLEKLEHKTMKIKEKKLSLTRPSDDDISSRNISKSRPIGLPLSDTELLMDASAVGHHESTIPHMSGGETYQQEWEVVNTGDMQWTEDTELRYAWGSEALKPVERHVTCPKLKPGEKGTVVVYLEIPRKPGNYECYWHFYHDCRRFGHWLGCQVIVDPSHVKLPSPLKEHALGNNEKEMLSKSLTSANWSCTSKKLKTDEDLKLDPLRMDDNMKFCLMSKNDIEKPLNTCIDLVKDEDDTEEIRTMSGELQELKIYDTIVIPDSNSSSDSDNQSIVSIADSSSSIHSAPSDEFVVVPMPEYINVVDDINVEEEDQKNENSCICSTIKLEKIDCVKSDNDGNGDKTEEIVVSEETEDNKIKDLVLDGESQFENKNKSAYAYVTVNARKIAVPKWLLRTDYLATAEDAPAPVATHDPIIDVSATEDAPVVDPFGNAMAVSTPIGIMTEENNKSEISSFQNYDDSQQIENVPINLSLDKHDIQDSKVTESVCVSSNCNATSGHGSIDNSIHSNMEPLSESVNNPNKSRLFVFPLNCPGFEVVYPPNSFIESLPAELESMESNQNSKVTDGNSPYGVVYLNHPWPYYQNVGTENLSGYNWSKSDSAYSYTPVNSPPQPTFKYEPIPQQTQNANGANHSFHEGPTNEMGSSNTLHHRFGTYMRHRSPFNHAKHCSGIRCRQPFFRNAPQASTTARGETNETFSQYSGSTNNNYQRRWQVPKSRYSAGLTPPRTTASNEGQNSAPANGNANRSTVHILPDTLVSGAVNVASSAINTARSVLNMFSPPPKQEQGQWENRMWSTSDPESPRERGLRILSEMGFWDRNLNATLLARYNDDLARVISELVQ